MKLLESYILRIAFGAFAAVLLALTAVIWVTQLLRELDLVTSKGQTIVMFLTVTGLSLPTLTAVIAPVALFIAVLYTLNRLNSDTELIVMSAAGVAPGRLLRPFLVLAGFVSLLVAFLALYAMPVSFQELRELVQRIRGDFLANIVKEGQFTRLENGITFHFRERSSTGALLGVFMQDRREADRTVVYLAERGQTFELGGQSYLVLEQGSIHRQQAKAKDSSIVAFERYALDLNAFNEEGGEVIYKPRERLTLQLLFPRSDDAMYRFLAGRFRAELHDRLSAWLYPFAMMLVAFAALGDARTTRHGRGTALAAAVVVVGLMRIAGFMASSAAVRSPTGVIAVYAVPLGTIVLAVAVTFHGPRLRTYHARTVAWAGQALRRLIPPVPLLRGA